MDFRGDNSYPRGMRNNNPGNLRDSGINWEGKTGTDPDGFVIFSDSVFGLRALALDLTNVMNQDGLTTVQDIITHYAPPSENDTASYITDVSADMGVNPTDELTYNATTLASLVRAVMNHEEGNEYSSMIPDTDIQTALSELPNPLIAQVGSFITANPELQQSAGIGVIAFVVVAFILLVRYRKQLVNVFRNVRQ